jgi:hypothetical protein
MNTFCVSLLLKIGKVIEGQDTLDNLYKGYGDMPPFGEGPDQSEIFRQGNAYVRSLYPKIDFLNTCSLIDLEPEEQEMHQDRSEFEPEDDDNEKVKEQGDVVNHFEAEAETEVSEQCLPPN